MSKSCSTYKTNNAKIAAQKKTTLHRVVFYMGAEKMEAYAIAVIFTFTNGWR